MRKSQHQSNALQQTMLIRRWTNFIVSSQWSSVSWAILLLRLWLPACARFSAASPCSKISCSWPHSECALIPPTTFPCLSSGEHVTQHHNADWVLSDGQEVSGSHCGVRNFIVPANVTAFVTAWKGTGQKGGHFLVDAGGDISILGTLQASGKGFHGGQRPNVRNNQDGLQGESEGGEGGTSTDANAGGGGGGIGGLHFRNHRVSVVLNARPGGGGGYGTRGDDGHVENKSIVVSGAGKGGHPYGNDQLSTVSLGSGGGSGGSYSLDQNPPGGQGGNGGGAVQLISRTGLITIAGSVLADGADGEGDSDVLQCGQCSTMCGQSCSRSLIDIANNTKACWDLAGPGGGGSGGSIYLRAARVDISGRVWAKGGHGGVGIGWLGGCGGNGGLGRIRIDTDELSGQTSPAPGYQEYFSTAQCVCSHGYASNSTACQPVCRAQCIHGNCVAPDTCRCESGFGGVNCSEAQTMTSTIIATEITTSTVQGINKKNAAGAPFKGWLWLSFIPAVLLVSCLIIAVWYHRHKRQQVNLQTAKIGTPSSFQFYSTNGSLTSNPSWPSSAAVKKKLSKLPASRVGVSESTDPAEPKPNHVYADLPHADHQSEPDGTQTTENAKHVYDQLSLDTDGNPNGSCSQPKDASGYLLPTDSSVSRPRAQSESSASRPRICPIAERSATVSTSSLHSYEYISHRPSLASRRKGSSSSTKPHLYASIDESIHEEGLFSPGPNSPLSVFSVSTVSIDLPATASNAVSPSLRPLPAVSESLMSPWSSSSKSLLLPASPAKSSTSELPQSPTSCVLQPQLTNPKNTFV